ASTYNLVEVGNTETPPLPAGLTWTGATRVLSGTPTAIGEYNMSYTAVDAAGPGTTETATQTFTITVSAAPGPVGAKGLITDFKLVGDVMDKTIAGEKRHHVPEGSQGVDLSVTVQWTHKEIEDIGYDTPQTINVMIMDGRGVTELPDWLSWKDADGQDVHFPRTAGQTGTVTVKTPRESQIPSGQRGSPNHTYNRTATLDLLILHDDHEAENDAFYIMATGGDVMLDVRGGLSRMPLDAVIEDDEEQKVRIRNSKFSTGPTNFYEPAGDSTIDSSPTFHVDAVPARRDLPLEVRLDIDQGQTVSEAQISLGAATLMLNDSDAGTGNSETVDVNLPDSDGNRMNDSYTLNASVNVYSVATGGYRTIPVAEHAITVLDRHRLPWLVDDELDPSMATVAEGGMVELEVTIHRNPSNTFVGPAAINSGDVEKRLYSDEEVTVMLSMGAGSTTTASDYSIMPAAVTFPERTRGSYTASMMLEVEATKDDELDDMEMLVLDAEVAGGVTAHGSDNDMYMGVSTLTIEDETVKQIEPKTEAAVKKAFDDAKAAGAGDEGLNPDESFSVEVSDLFTVTDGYAADYDVSVSGDAVTARESNGTVEISAVEVGESTVTITAKAARSMSSAVMTRQTAADSAEVDYVVQVVNKKLMVTVAAEPMTIEEGETSTITATADRAVHADDGMVKIDLAVTGPATLSADSITIAAGEMNGSVTLTATDDDDYDDETVTVIASGSGITGQQSLTITVTDPDEATPTVRAKADAAEKIAAAIAKAAGGAEWMVGGMVAEVEMDGLFDLDEGVTATYQGTSSDADVVKAITTGNTLMLT
ncbi:MAG: putative Ig domain-containing protein, partial [Rhodococcus sp.]|nr:putative Ig domain-containing protein [Rhodococcus sp. (in: high G+C Gram-positive bacteria)]